MGSLAFFPRLHPSSMYVRVSWPLDFWLNKTHSAQLSQNAPATKQSSWLNPRKRVSYARCDEKPSSSMVFKSSFDTIPSSSKWFFAHPKPQWPKFYAFNLCCGPMSNFLPTSFFIAEMKESSIGVFDFKSFCATFQIRKYCCNTLLVILCWL